MIRAFALLSFAMFAACAHSHVSPPGQTQGTWVQGAPEDPYADGASSRQRCGPGETCSFECPTGGCSFSCGEGSTCNVACEGGGCRLACGFNATCNLACDGGQCGTRCATGATGNREGG